MQDASNLLYNVGGQFSDGNPATNVKATVLQSNFQNDLMNNILQVITDAGTGMTDDDSTDLSTAIKNLLTIADIANLGVEHNTDGTHSDVTAESIKIGDSTDARLNIDTLFESSYINHNCYWNGSAWQAYDTSIEAWQISLENDTSHRIMLKRKATTSTPWTTWDFENALADSTGGISWGTTAGQTIGIYKSLTNEITLDDTNNGGTAYSTFRFKYGGTKFENNLGTDLVINSIITSETTAMFAANTRGDLLFGPGGVSSQDIKLARTTTGTFSISNPADGEITRLILNSGITRVTSYLSFDTVEDVRFERTATKQLTVDDGSGGEIEYIIKGYLHCIRTSVDSLGIELGITTDTNPRYSVDAEGDVMWGAGSSFTQDVRMGRSGTNKITIDDNDDQSANVIMIMDNGYYRSFGTVITDGAFWAGMDGDTQARNVIRSDGRQFYGAGGASVQDIMFQRTGSQKLQLSDNGGGNCEFDLVGTMYQPDVSGGTANSGKFVGGNGGFMWFDGETNGTTAVTLETTLDWRDRWISVRGFIRFTASSSSNVPGGASDDTLTGNMGETTSGSAAYISDFMSTHFYSETGGAAAGSGSGGFFDDEDNDTIYIWADSTSGDLKLGKSADTGDEAAFGLLVIFSDDQGHV